MTREEAITILKDNICGSCYYSCSNGIDSCYIQGCDNREAIKALEQEPCEDAVSRQAVIEITAETGALETQIRVKALPSVTPQPKTGRWIVKDYYTKMGEHYKGYECPVCHKEYNLKTNFCPNCGNRNGE